MQGRRRRQARLGLPRTDRHPDRRRQDRWRHYAGPGWEYGDGSAVVGKVVGNAPGASAGDIPWLKLEVASRRGNGVLTPVTTVQRINTNGGKLDGTCDAAGSFKSAPYSADYVFLRKG